MNGIGEKKQRSDALNELIVQMRVRLARTIIPSTDCPYMYYSLNNRTKNDIDCSKIECQLCEKQFFEDYEKEVRESEEAKMPDLLKN